MSTHSTRRIALGIIGVVASLASGASAAPAPGAATTVHGAPPISVTPTPLPSGVSLKSPVFASLFPPPTLVHAVTGDSDCYGHFAARYAFQGRVECRALISGGNLVLIWDAPPSASVDGYRVYPVETGGAPGPLVASVYDHAQTIAKLPIVPGGERRCYVVTATYKARESVPARPFCPGPDSTTVTRTIGAAYTHFAFKEHSHTGAVGDFKPGDNMPNGAVVGYYYTSEKHTLGDVSYAKIHRYAVAFDVDSFKTKRLVSATLQLTIELSYGQGNNHSCATSVATGREFWWKPDAAAWLEGDFVSAARVGDTGPIVSADVTGYVAPVLAGTPNYGLVIRNDDENLDAFTNAQCETVYTNPQLVLVYYDR